MPVVVHDALAPSLLCEFLASRYRSSSHRSSTRCGAPSQVPDERQEVAGVGYPLLFDSSAPPADLDGGVGSIAG